MTRVPRLTSRPSSCGRSTGTSAVRISVLYADELDEIDESVRVAPLVVVPAEHLDHATVRHRVDRGVDARRGIADDVRGHELLLGVLEHTAIRRVGSRLGKRLVDLVDR